MIDRKQPGLGAARIGKSEGSPTAARAQRLMAVDGLIDWSAFDRYLLWTEADCARHFGFRPLTLFKALLLKHWFRLRTDEFDHDMADRASFQRFVVGDATLAVPDHASVTAFGRLLRDRGLGPDLMREMENQLSRLEVSPPESSIAELMRAMGVENPFNFSSELPPADWLAIEDPFLDLWTARRGAAPAPSLRDVTLTDLQPFERHLAILRVLDDGRDFGYEFVGRELEAANGAAFTGMSVADKARHNLETYGHAGLQGELLQTLSGCMAEMRPMRMTAYFRTAGGAKCQLWTIQAPLVDFDTGRPVKLVAAAMIRALSIN